MASIARSPAIQTWLEPRAESRRSVPKLLARQKAVELTKSIGLFEPMLEMAIAVPATVISCSVQFLLYAGAILVFPFLPFLAPLFFAAPLVLLLSFTVRAFGAVLTATGRL